MESGYLRLNDRHRFDTRPWLNMDHEPLKLQYDGLAVRHECIYTEPGWTINIFVIKNYYSLTKSGLIYGNLITVIGGFALGTATAGETIIFGKLVATLIGISFVMASGCVFNNYV